MGVKKSNGDGEGGPAVAGDAVEWSGMAFGADGGRAAEAVDECLADIRVFGAHGVAEMHFDVGSVEAVSGVGLDLVKAAGPEGSFKNVFADGHAERLDHFDDVVGGGRLLKCGDDLGVWEFGELGGLSVVE